MPSPPNGPYQSRLLNFLNRQSIRLSDRWSKTVRQLKVTLKWGAQILLYPIYILVQTGRLVGRQLEQKFLPPSKPVDIEIQAVSAIVPISEETPMIIQGIASSVDNHDLVLVDQDNQIIPIVNLPEQEELEKYIKLHMANIERQRRLAQIAIARKSIAQLPKINSQLPRLLPPVRLFWKVMEWIEIGEVARTVNLFGESSLSSIPIPIPSTPLPIKPIPHHSQQGWLKQLENQLNTSEDIAKELQAIIRAAIDYFFTRKSQQSQLDAQPTLQLPGTGKIVPATQEIIQTIGSRFQQVLPNKQQEQDLQPDPFQIQLLIKAAIDYFFASKSHHKQLSSTSEELEDDPWLSSVDLFEDEYTPRENVATNPQSPPRPNQLPPTTKIQVAKTNNQQIQPQQYQTYSLTQPELEESSLDIPEEDCLETEATPVGYVKHPLETILEWLDTSLLWIEEVIITMWEWFRNKFRR